MAELQAAVIALQVDGTRLILVAVERASRNAGDFAAPHHCFSVDAHPNSAPQ